MVALIEAVNEQNAIHDDLGDTSRQLDQLRDISRQLEPMSINLSTIAGMLANKRW